MGDCFGSRPICFEFVNCFDFVYLLALFCLFFGYTFEQQGRKPLKGNKAQAMRKGTTMRYETIVTIKAKAYVNGSYGLIDDWYDTIIEEHEKAMTTGYDDRPGPEVAADILIDFINENDFSYYDGQMTDDKQDAIAMYTDALEVAASIDAYNKFIDEWELNYNLPELTYTIELVDWDADECGDYRHCNQDGRLATFNGFGSQWHDQERHALSVALERTDNERVHKMAEEFEKNLMTETMNLLRKDA